MYKTYLDHQVTHDLFVRKEELGSFIFVVNEKFIIIPLLCHA
jgi:hypothetical protein